MGTTYENSCVMTFKDSSSNLYKMYPVTKKSNVVGIDEAIRNQGVITEGTGAAYTATVDGVTALSAGVSFVMVPHTVSTSTSPTLDVNSLGAKYIRRRVSSGTATTSAGSSDDWLAENKPITVVYDGTFWIAGNPRPNATDIMGSVSIQNGGTGATTAAEARTNIGAVNKLTAAITLSADNWSSETQAVNVSGVTSDNTIIVSPAPESFLAYGEAGVRCTAQGANSLTFTCAEVPSEDLTVNVVIFT